MSEFNVRADSVNVEQIMDQIRARIRDKRGVDYTEDQIRELASVKLEKFLDPRGIRSDLLEQFRKAQPPAPPIALYPFEDTTLFDSHRGIVRLFRRLLRPLMKLFFNSNALAQSLHQQTIINRLMVDRLNAIDQRGDLYYELLHNLVLELTRATVEVKNVAMRVESISSRLDFNERRARALESVVVYKTAEPEREARPATPSTPPPAPQRGGGSYASREGQRYAPQAASPRPPAAQPAQAVPSPSPGASAPAAPAVATNTAPASASTSGATDAAVPGEGPGQRSRRRRRRRGRRGGASAAAVMGSNAGSGLSESEARDAQAEPSEPISGSPAQAIEPREDAPSPAVPSQPAPSQPAPSSSTPASVGSSAIEPPPSPAAHDDDDQ
jgi:hypothetical protein